MCGLPSFSFSSSCVFYVSFSFCTCAFFAAVMALGLPPLLLHPQGSPPLPGPALAAVPTMPARHSPASPHAQHHLHHTGYYCAVRPDLCVVQDLVRHPWMTVCRGMMVMQQRGCETFCGQQMILVLVAAPCDPTSHPLQHACWLCVRVLGCWDVCRGHPQHLVPHTTAYVAQRVLQKALIGTQAFGWLFQVCCNSASCVYSCVRCVCKVCVMGNG